MSIWKRNPSIGRTLPKSKKKYRIFLKGMDVTSLVDKIEIIEGPFPSGSWSASPSESPSPGENKPGIHTRGVEPDDKEHQGVNILIKNMEIHSIENDSIFIGYLPDNEFLNEMIKIKLRR